MKQTSHDVVFANHIKLTGIVVVLLSCMLLSVCHATISMMTVIVKNSTRLSHQVIKCPFFNAPVKDSAGEEEEVCCNT